MSAVPVEAVVLEEQDVLVVPAEVVEQAEQVVLVEVAGLAERAETVDPEAVPGLAAQEAQAEMELLEELVEAAERAEAVGPEAVEVLEAPPHSVVTTTLTPGKNATRQITMVNLVKPWDSKGALFPVICLAPMRVGLIRVGATSVGTM